MVEVQTPNTNSNTSRLAVEDLMPNSNRGSLVVEDLTPNSNRSSLVMEDLMPNTNSPVQTNKAIRNLLVVNSSTHKCSSPPMKCSSPPMKCSSPPMKCKITCHPSTLIILYPHCTSMYNCFYMQHTSVN